MLDRHYLTQIVQLFCQTIAHSRPMSVSFQEDGALLFMRVALLPFNDAKVMSLNVWVTDGTNVRLQVADQRVPEGGSDSGFEHVSASEEFTFQSETETADDFVGRIALLSLQMA